MSKQSAPRVDSVVDSESEDDSTSVDDADDDEDSKPVEMPKRNAVPEKRLVVIPFERTILTFSPPSSPTSENGEANMYVDIAPRAKNDQAQTPVQSMATSLVDLIRNKANKALIRAAEDTLVDHLHYTAVTLAGHEAMLPPHSWNPQNQRPITPSLALNPRVMSKLAANIGLNTSRGRISADDLDAMKFHILTHGDENNGSLTVSMSRSSDSEHRARSIS